MEAIYLPLHLLVYPPIELFKTLLSGSRIGNASRQTYDCGRSVHPSTLHAHGQCGTLTAAGLQGSFPEASRAPRISF